VITVPMIVDSGSSLGWLEHDEFFSHSEVHMTVDNRLILLIQVIDCWCVGVPLRRD